MLSIEEDYEALIQFLYLAPVGLAQTSIDGDVVMINPISAQLLMPISRDGDLTNLFSALEPVAPELRHLCANFSERYGMVCDALRIQINAGVPGKSDPQILSLTLLKLDESRLMAVLNDISLQVKRERQLKQNEAWFKAIMTGIADYALVSLDRQGRVEDWNASIGRVTGFSREEVIGKPYGLFYPPGATTPDCMLDRLRDADRNGWSLDEGYQAKADGSRFWASTMITPLQIHDAVPADGTGHHAADEPSYCLVMHDISEVREASERHRIATSRDYLTGTANRRAFFEAAGVELEHMKHASRTLSLILFDADHFKKINERCGQAAGDAMLRHLAAALTVTFRQVDVVARFGGEEFAVLMPSTGVDDALVVAERFREMIEGGAITVDGLSVVCTVSGGVASVEGGEVDFDLLMKRADEALHAAKARGRNRIESWAAA